MAIRNSLITLLLIGCYWAGSSNAAPSARACDLPECFAPKSGIPGGLTAAQTPQLVYFTFDDAVNSVNSVFYDQLFADTNTNPNGCPIRATLMDSHNYTDYAIVAQMYFRGFEFGSHSITHKEPQDWWHTATVAEYEIEIQGQRLNLNDFSGIPIDEVRSMRVPFLAMGADNQFTMLHQNNFTYDASMVANVYPPSWPFTLHNPILVTADVCSNQQYCPKNAYPLWELPINMWYWVGEFNCTATMIDGCRPSVGGFPNRTAAFDYLKFNFDRHYTAVNKPPLGVNMHASWFSYSNEYLLAMDDFIKFLLEKNDVYIVKAHQVIEWIRNPTPLSDIATFPPFTCAGKGRRGPRRN